MFVGPQSVTGAIALLLFPIAAVVVLRAARGSSRAAIALLLAGALFLPSGLAIDLPGLPALFKDQISYLAVLAGLLIARSPALARSRPGRGLEILTLPMAIGAVLTTVTNSDLRQYGPTLIAGLPLGDLGTAVVTDVLRYGLPMYLGRCLIRRVKDLGDVLVLLTVAGLAYSLLCLVEIRLSPQLHRWVYGYHPNVFSYAVRFGGYRPMVFMESGIAVGIFMASTVVASVTLLRARFSVRLPLSSLATRLVPAYLAGVLVLCKSVAAALQGLALSAAVLLLPIRLLAAAALAMAAFAVLYPAIRMAELFPLEGAVEFARGFDENRAASLSARFENEELMLEKWRERPLFGWGGYRRSWVFDPVTGNNLIVPDGFWIIRLGGYGLVGFVATFALYVIPILAAATSFRRFGRREQFLLVGAALIVALRLVDQLPNGFYMSFPITLAGGLWTVARSRSVQRGLDRKVRPRPADAPSGGSRPPLPSSPPPAGDASRPASLGAGLRGGEAGGRPRGDLR